MNTKRKIKPSDITEKTWAILKPIAIFLGMGMITLIGIGLILAIAVSGFLAIVLSMSIFTDLLGIDRGFALAAAIVFIAGGFIGMVVFYGEAQNPQ